MNESIRGAGFLNSNRDNSLLNRNFILIIVSSFIFFFNFHSFILFPIRIQELGGSVSTIGFIMGAAWISTIFTTPLVGVLVDRWGGKWFLASGGLVMSLTTLPFAYLGSLNFLFPVLRMLQGASLSLCFISAGTLTAEVSPLTRRAQALGIFGLFAIINHALAPYVGKLIIESSGFKIFFQFVFAIGLLSFFVSILIDEPGRSDKSNEKGSSYLNTFLRMGVPVSAFTLMLVGVGFITTITFLPVFSKGIGVESFQDFFLAYTISALGMRLFGGWIPDRYGKKRTSVPSLLFFSISICWLGFSSNRFDLIYTGILFGLSHGLLYPSIYALVIDLAPMSDKGKAFSICSVAFTFGGMLGTIIYGSIAELYGFKIMYQMVALSCLLGFVVFSFYGREGVNGVRS